MRKGDKIIPESVVHRFIHDNPKCCIADMMRALETSRTIASERCETLIEEGKIKRDQFSSSTQYFYQSIETPPEQIDFTPTRECTPPRVLLSRLWLPNHLELTA